MIVTARSVVLTALVWTLACAGGCGWRAKKVDVTMTGPELGRDSRPMVDVSNWNGSVEVIVSSRFKRADVRAKVRRASGADVGRRELARESAVTAQSTTEGGRPVLRVRSTTSIPDPTQGRAELLIRLPACAGAVVRNSGGLVELRGVGGPITVENGVNNGPGGRVEIRTSEPLTDPVTVTTSEGTIYFQVGPNSAGRFDLLAEGGEAALDAQRGVIKFESYAKDRFVATLNGGENPVTLRSGRGVVYARVIDDARDVKPSRRTAGFMYLRGEPPR